MAYTHNNPIDLIVNFKRLNNVPLDDSTVVPTYIDLSTITNRYDGIIVYVESLSEHHYYDGSTWLPLGGGGSSPGGILGSIQVKGGINTFSGWSDYLWDNVAKKMTVSKFALESVDNTIKLYDDINYHYATFIGSGSPVEKALDFIDPVRFDILVHDTVPNARATFTLQPSKSDALSFISANDRLMRFRTSTGDLKIEMHQTLNLQDVVDGDVTMEALVWDSATMDVKKFPMGGGADLSVDINQTGIGLLVSIDDIIADSSGAYVLANATDDTKIGIGFVTEIVDDDNIKIQDTGEIDYATGGLIKGQTYLLGLIDGSITSVEPSNYIQPVALATASDRLLVNIEPMFVYDTGVLPDIAFTDLTDKDSIKQEATNLGDINGAVVLNMENNHIYATVDGDITSISFINNPSATEYKTLVLTITQDDTTFRSIDWTGSGVHAGYGLSASDLELQQVLSSITQYYLYWAGHLGYWSIAKEEVEIIAL